MTDLPIGDEPLEDDEDDFDPEDGFEEGDDDNTPEDDPDAA